MHERRSAPIEFPIGALFSLLVRLLDAAVAYGPTTTFCVIELTWAMFAPMSRLS
jgi:hypothetical protein